MTWHIIVSMPSLVRICRRRPCFSVIGACPVAEILTSQFPNYQRISRRYRHVPRKNTGEVIKSNYSDITWPETPLTEFIWKDIDRWENKIALECAKTGKKYTYAQVKDVTYRFAGALSKAIKGKDVKKLVMAVILPNCPEYAPAFLGSSHIGMVVTTVNPTYTAEEISQQMKNSGSTHAITNAFLYKNVSEAVKKLGKLANPIPIIITGSKIPTGAISFQEMVDNGKTDDIKKPEKFDVEDTVALPFSSGTMGLPKGAMLSHRNIIANILQGHQKEVALIKPTTDQHQEIVLAVIPFFHIYGMVVAMLGKLVVGAKIVTVPRFDPHSFVEDIANCKASLLYVVPTLLLFLASHPGVTDKSLPHLKIIMSGAAPLGVKDAERFLMKVKHQIEVLQGYGLTESSPLVSYQTPHEKPPRNLASVGHPLPNTYVKFIDIKTGECCVEPKRYGELCVKGPQVMKGYLNNPEATKDIIDKDGWLHTGDIGYYDVRQHLYIVDRLKEIIKVKGFQVAPVELEAILRTHPAVENAGVVGVPHPRFGEVPLAFVVLKKNLKGTATDDIEKALKKWVAVQVAPYKQLEGGVVFLDSLPVSPSGKLLRKYLRAAATVNAPKSGSGGPKGQKDW